ncbi:MAG: FAD-binding protein [Desulfarculus sp.]|nr:MAG: FAD-binding protein [Desulfarculus sp.]
MSAEKYDIVILGTGPAGLQAAIHAARKKRSVLVLGRGHKSSLYKAHVENFCCMPGMGGGEILAAGREQAEKFGARFLDEDVIKIERELDNSFLLSTEGGRRLTAKALILAMGISRHHLGVPGEKELLGRGVSYCVDCDGNFFRGLPVAVVGGESAAVAGALQLLFFASEVHLVCRKLEVSGPLAESLGDSAVILHQGAWPQEIQGDKEVDGLLLDNGQSLAVKGVFIELGAKGAIELAASLGVNLDPENMQYVLADKKGRTNVEGIFAAGDITGPPWQMAKAVGEGCVAGLEAAAFVKGSA